MLRHAQGHGAISLNHHVSMMLAKASGRESVRFWDEYERRVPNSRMPGNTGYSVGFVLIFLEILEHARDVLAGFPVRGYAVIAPHGPGAGVVRGDGPLELVAPVGVER